jgi:dihydroorotate dehydrogenase electron transfer subunit
MADGCFHFEDAPLLERIELDESHFLLYFDAPAICEDARPGQFVETRVDESFTPLLRRPMSVLSCRDGRLGMLVEVKGEGTRKLCRTPIGTPLSLIGPLGAGFPSIEPVVLIGGGTGVAPLLFYASEHPGSVLKFVAGFRTRPVVPLLDLMRETVVPLEVCTEDASLGIRGTVCDGLPTSAETGGCTFLVCGPVPMFRALQGLLPEERTYVSLEGMMACGTGLCLGCAVKRKGKPGYLRTCTDGPVFRLSEVDINSTAKL